MDELTERIARSTVFSKVDLLWGYLQLALAEVRRYLTSFVTHEGVYRFRSLPFGLVSGPSTFHQVVRKILDGLDSCVSNLDEILIYCHTVAEHDERLHRVLDQLVKDNATVRQDKCIIGVPEVNFNGHRVLAAAVRPLTSNVEAIQAIPVPINMKQLLRFVFTASYYLKFVPDFAEIWELLRLLLKADAVPDRIRLELVWNWSTACLHSFEIAQDQDRQPAGAGSFRRQRPDDRDLCFVSRRR